MNWVRASIGLSVLLWWSIAMSATLMWDANGEPDLAGYRVYQCGLTPCGPGSGNLLATLGKVTSYNVGTPSGTQYYYVTAYDFANNESAASNVLNFTPATSLPPTPTSLANVTLTVVGNPATGPWGIEARTTDVRDVMATVRLDGVTHHVESYAPYGFPGDDGATVTTGRFGSGSHTIEFIFYLQDTTTEIGRSSTTVQEGSLTTPVQTNPSNITLTVVGNPATGPWGIEAKTTDVRDVMASVRLDGVTHHVESYAPYGFPGDDGTRITTARFGSGSHSIEFIFYLQDTTTEIGRASITVQEAGQ